MTTYRSGITGAQPGACVAPLFVFSGASKPIQFDRRCWRDAAILGGSCQPSWADSAT
jgi:hypothetical protein